MRFRRPSVLSMFLYALLFVSLPAVSMDEVSNADADKSQGFRSSIRKESFRAELCNGRRDGEFSVARLMVAGQEKILLHQRPYVVIAETFEDKRASSSIEKLAVTIAAEAIAAMVRQEQINKPLSLNSAEVFCLAILMNYDSYLKMNSYAHATEIELINIAGAAFDEVFGLMRRAEFLSRTNT